MSADPIDLVVQRSKLLRQFVLKLVDGLTDEQMSFRPAPTAHSIGWTLWHIARCADRFNADIPSADGRTQKEIWGREGLTKKWGLTEALLGTNGMGTGVDDAVAATLQPPAKDALLDYTTRAFAALDETVGTIDAQRWQTEHTSIFASTPVPVGRSLISSISHDSRHLGEMEFVKGLLGLRGSVTT